MLAACGSTRGASREIFRLALSHDWSLIATPYVLDEVQTNLSDLSQTARIAWLELRKALQVLDDILTLDRPAVFSPAKDRPILFSALAWADVLLTLDHGDFAALMGRGFYDLAIMRPGIFLARERAAGRIGSEEI